MTRVEVVCCADFKNYSNFYPFSVVGSHYGGAQIMILPENSDFWPNCMIWGGGGGMILRNCLPNACNTILLKIKQKFLMNMHVFSRYLRNLVKISIILGSNFQIINNSERGTIIPDSRVGCMFFL